MPARTRVAGTIETAFTESIDVMPTILDWLGGEIPRTCDGESLLPFLAGRPAAAIGAPSCTMNTTSATCSIPSRSRFLGLGHE